MEIFSSSGVPVIRNAELEIAGLSPGRYELLIYSVDDARELSRTRVNVDTASLTVRIPEIKAHAAIRIVSVHD